VAGVRARASVLWPMSRCTCGEHIAELCAGAITTAERVRELTAATPAKGGIVTAIDITWLSTSAAAATVTNYNSAPLLRTLAGRRTGS